MSKLISTYARSTGLKISKPYLMEEFYPLTTDKYITLQTGSGQAAKNYDYYQEVLFLIKPILDANNISIVHLGGTEDSAMNGVIDLRGKTSIHQSHFIINRALAHMGNDSWIQHISNFNKIPTLTLFGTTSAANHGSYWVHDKTVFLESHRNDNVPSYGQEGLKTINQIPPEEVAEKILDLIGIRYSFDFSTMFLGLLYSNTIFELIPNVAVDKSFFPDLPLTVRLDLAGKEGDSNLVEMLKVDRKVNLVINRPLNLETFTQFKNNIVTLNCELNDSFPTEYVKNLKSICPKAILFTRSKDVVEINALKFKYMGVCNIETAVDPTKSTFLDLSEKYLNKPIDFNNKLPNLWFKSNKFILSNGQIYGSHAHEQAKIPLASFDQNKCQIIDSQEFWKDLNHYNIFYVRSN